jgi:hypothetical protein
MFTKSLLSISLLLPLVAMSATAHAGSTITDKSYWPSEAKPAVHLTTGASQNKSRDAFASSMTRADENGNEWRYQGGPKYQAMRSGGR